MLLCKHSVPVTWDGKLTTAVFAFFFAWDHLGFTVSSPAQTSRRSALKSSQEATRRSGIPSVTGITKKAPFAPPPGGKGLPAVATTSHQSPSDSTMVEEAHTSIGTTQLGHTAAHSQNHRII